MLNILPLPMYIQSLNMLLFSQLSNEAQNSIELLQTQDMSSRSNELFKLPQTRREKVRKDVVFRTSRLVNEVNHLIDFISSTGIKKPNKQLLWRQNSTKTTTAPGSLHATAEIADKSEHFPKLNTWDKCPSALL